MSKVKMIIDSGCNIDLETAKKYDIDILSFRINVGSKTYTDLYELPSKEFFEILDSTDQRVTTSIPSPDSFKQLLDKNLELGYDQFICFTITQKFSGMNQMMNIVAEEYEQKHNCKIKIFDTDNATTAVYYPLLDIAESVKNGMSYEDLIEKSQKCLKKVSINALVRSLDALANGGRLPKAVAKLGNIVAFSPILTIENGVINVKRKITGKKRSYNEFIKLIKNELGQSKNYKLLIGYGNNEDEVLKLKESLKEEIANAKEFELLTMTPVIGVHVGSGALLVSIYKMDE